PCPPQSLGKVKVQRLWRNTPITVSFDAAGFSQGVRPTLTINGKTLVGNIIPSALVSEVGDNGSRRLEVEVTWPAANRAPDFPGPPLPVVANLSGQVSALRSNGS